MAAKVMYTNVAHVTKHDVLVVDDPALVPKHFLFLVPKPL